MDYLLLFLLIVLIVINIILLILVKSSIKSQDTIDTDMITDSVRDSISELQSNLIKSQIENQNSFITHYKDLSENLLARLNESNKNIIAMLSNNYDHYNRTLSSSFTSMHNASNETNKNQREVIEKSFNSIATSLFSHLKADREFNSEVLTNNSRTLTNGLTSLTNTTDTKLNLLITNINESFIEMRKEMNQQIDNIRQTVNEKLDKTLNEQFEKSFRGVLTQMNDLQKSMGELKSISNQVGSLEKTLNGVKTRGIMGEVQLKQIIADVLTPSQYDVEIPTRPDSTEHVEIAIKIPERSGKGHIYLPIDSKCHLDRYEELLNAYDSGNSDFIKAAKKKFSDAIKSDAQNICDKYICTPYTTPYAVLFVPFEGMYSEIVNLNLLDELNKYHITVAGPYTLMAILSTITNYFQALAIEKKSQDIEITLGKVKTEFGKYNSTLSKVRTSLDRATRNLDELQLTRTRAMEKALSSITEINDEPLLTDSDSLWIDNEDYE